MVKTDIKRLRFVGIHQQCIRHEGQMLNCCGIIGMTSLQLKTHIQILARLTQPDTLKFHGVGAHLLLKLIQRYNRRTRNLPH